MDKTCLIFFLISSVIFDHFAVDLSTDVIPISCECLPMQYFAIFWAISRDHILLFAHLTLLLMLSKSFLVLLYSSSNIHQWHFTSCWEKCCGENQVFALELWDLKYFAHPLFWPAWPWRSIYWTLWYFWGQLPVQVEVKMKRLRSHLNGEKMMSKEGLSFQFEVGSTFLGDQKSPL